MTLDRPCHVVSHIFVLDVDRGICREVEHRL
jgi:hypothetical protein